MKVMVIVKASNESEAGAIPDPEMLAAMGRYNEELVKAGIMLAADGLRPSSTGVRMHFDGASRTVTDGPFAETKELIAGFWIWQVHSMEEAVEWLKKCPNPMPGASDIDIRPIAGPEDFAEWGLTEEFQAYEQKLRDQIAAKS